MHKLLLMVTDAFMLERGTLPYCYFDLAGGLVGSASNVNWKIDNWKNEISDIEFEIKYYNADFCLIAHSNKLFINGTTSALPMGGIIKLNDNDLISLCNYKIRAKIFTNEAEMVTLQDELSYLLNKQTDNTILNLGHSQQCYYDFEKVSINQDLLELKANDTNLDPLLALKVDDEPSSELINAMPHQFESMEYKFFNPHIHSVLEYYTPMNINESPNELVKTISTMEYEEVQNSVSTFKDKGDTKTKQVEPILDPLFFIK
ncbi:MAG: hypothetical protein E6Z57_07200 [Haemophilus parainfluenzae]|jgi:hypothetical protein|nr:hypothetical protein [Haemophilus parainfluenzae]